MSCLQGFAGAIVGLIALSDPSLAGDHYVIDQEHVSVSFSIQHSKWAKYQGTIRGVMGDIDFDKTNVANSSVKARMHSSDVDTLADSRKQVVSVTLDAMKNPDISFKSTAIKQTGEKTGQVIGDLTMAGVTKPVTLNVTFDGEGKSSWDSMNRVGFSATGSLDCNDFGLTVLQQYEIGPKLDFAIEIEATRF